MRLILTLIIASVVGSTLVGGLRSILRERPLNSYQTVVQLYRQDKPSTVRLIERASFKCLPGLSNINSVRLRNSIPLLIARIIEAKVQGQPLSKTQFSKQLTDDIVMPAARGASISDLKQMAELVEQGANKKNATARCIAETVVSMSKSREQVQPKALLEGTQLRGT